MQDATAAQPRAAAVCTARAAHEAAKQELRWNMYWIGVSKLLEDTEYQEKLQMCI